VVTFDQGGFASAEPPAEVGAHRAAEPDPLYDDEGLSRAPSPTKRPSGFVSAWRAFRAWRRRRPFWGAVLAILGGVEIFLTETAPISVVVHFGLVGQIGFAVPILVVLCGVLLLFAPNPRAFYASLILVLGLASWLTSNLGGFFLGMLLVLVGGALALSWTTTPRSKPRRAKARTTNHATGIDGG
jgi:hypothetical protein